MPRRANRNSKISETDGAAFGEVHSTYEDQYCRITVRKRPATDFCQDSRKLRRQLNDIVYTMWPDTPPDYTISSSRKRTTDTLCTKKQLRVDLQSIRDKQANIQVQINEKRPPSSIAAILLPTDTFIPSKDIRKAVIDSNEMTCIMTFVVEVKKQ